MAGMASHGANGPERPVRGRDFKMEARRDCCSGVISSRGGPVYRGLKWGEVSSYFFLFCCLMPCCWVAESLEVDMARQAMLLLNDIYRS